MWSGQEWLVGNHHAVRRGERAPSLGHFCGNVDGCVTVVAKKHAYAACEVWGRVIRAGGRD